MSPNQEFSGRWDEEQGWDLSMRVIGMPIFGKITLRQWRFPRQWYLKTNRLLPPK